MAPVVWMYCGVCVCARARASALRARRVRGGRHRAIPQILLPFKGKLILVQRAVVSKCLAPLELLVGLLPLLIYLFTSLLFYFLPTPRLNPPAVYRWQLSVCLPLAIVSCLPLAIVSLPSLPLSFHQISTSEPNTSEPHRITACPHARLPTSPAERHQCRRILPHQATFTPKHQCTAALKISPACWGWGGGEGGRGGECTCPDLRARARNQKCTWKMAGRKKRKGKRINFLNPKPQNLKQKKSKGKRIFAKVQASNARPTCSTT
jgi:hypothetical protein